MFRGATISPAIVEVDSSGKTSGAATPVSPPRGRDGVAEMHGSL
jgi:hypothetical protein